MGRRVPPAHVRAFRGRSLLLLALALVVLTTMPSHAAARCFGVPGESGEPEVRPEVPAWSVTIVASSANGHSDLATFGVDPQATDGFDGSFDVIESSFYFDPEGVQQFTLFAYFTHVLTLETATGNLKPGDTIGLTKSVVGARSNNSWNLQVAYYLAEETVITLEWNVEEVQKTGLDIDLFAPSGEVVYMANASRTSFEGGRGFYDFTVRALEMPAGEAAAPSAAPLTVALAGYLLAVAAILWLRRVRRKRQRERKQRDSVARPSLHRRSYPAFPGPPSAWPGARRLTSAQDEAWARVARAGLLVTSLRP